MIGGNLRFNDLETNALSMTPKDKKKSSIKKLPGTDKAQDFGAAPAYTTNNLPENQIDAFDSVVDSGNPAAIGIAFKGLQSQYNDANGYEGRMLSGKSANAGSSDVFRSQAELVAAMSDSRYESDPAYRNDLLEKLDRSDLNF